MYSWCIIEHKLLTINIMFKEERTIWMNQHPAEDGPSRMEAANDNDGYDYETLKGDYEFAKPVVESFIKMGLAIEAQQYPMAFAMFVDTFKDPEVAERFADLAFDKYNPMMQIAKRPYIGALVRITPNYWLVKYAHAGIQKAVDWVRGDSDSRKMAGDAVEFGQRTWEDLSEEEQAAFKEYVQDTVQGMSENLPTTLWEDAEVSARTADIVDDANEDGMRDAA